MGRDHDDAPPEASPGTSPATHRFEQVAIIGVGLMGGSLGLDLRRLGLARAVVGMGRTESTLAKAVEVGAIDAGTTSLVEAVSDADLVVVCAPVGSIPGLLAQMAPAVRENALITDMGSTKTHIAEAGARLFGCRFVGGHPMAGSEASGVDAARRDLFCGAAWAIVRCQPFELAEDPNAARLADLAVALGAVPIPLDAARHDRLVALISHLPHVLSYAFAATVAADPERDLARSLGAGSYRDLMRVSASDRALWRGIFRENRDALLQALTAYEERLRTLNEEILSDDPDLLGP